MYGKETGVTFHSCMLHVLSISIWISLVYAKQSVSFIALRLANINFLFFYRKIPLISILRDSPLETVNAYIRAFQ